MARWHGTPRGYKEERCRCAECRAWSAAARARQRRGVPLAHWWREYVHETWWLATLTWEAEREAVAIGYTTEQREFEAASPPPRFKDFLVGLAGAR